MRTERKDTCQVDRVKAEEEATAGGADVDGG